ncbi:MAG: peptidoglycan-binding domain-containing protein, partial [Candidatus Binatia bacterium]
MIKRLLLTLLMISLCGVASAFADETVRAVQTRLKDGGFYFGEADGVYNSETAAAVSRYQIRHGLQITGQIDAGTAKSLGVTTTASTAPSPGSEAETWRRLRKTDEQFLSKLNAGKIPPPAPPSKTTKPAVKEPPSPNMEVTAVPIDPDNGTLVLSRERLRDYVAAFVLAGLDPQIGAELEFFADR